MNFKKYVSSASNMFIENRFNKFVVLVLVGLLISQQMMLNNAFREHKVFLIPPGLKEKAAVSGSSLDPAYLKPMGVYAVSLLYSFTPATVVNKYAEFLTFMTPESYPSYSDELLKQASEYKENDVSKQFQVLEIRIYSNPDVIEIGGEVSKYITSQKVESKRVKLKIAYVVDNGYFRISSIEELK